MKLGNKHIKLIAYCLIAVCMLCVLLPISEALAAAEDWRKVVDGTKVRELKAEYPGIYPDVFRYTAYFAKWREILELMSQTAASKGCRVSEVECPDFNMVLLLLKLKFPEAYEICCS